MRKWNYQHVINASENRCQLQLCKVSETVILPAKSEFLSHFSQHMMYFPSIRSASTAHCKIAGDSHGNCGIKFGSLATNKILLPYKSVIKIWCQTLKLPSNCNVLFEMLPTAVKLKFIKLSWKLLLASIFHVMF